MFAQTFYHGHLRKYVVLFGTLFNDIYINRVDSDGDQISTLKVPISYAPKEKMIVRVDQDPDFKRPFSIVLPRMGFEMTSLTYSPTRKLSTIKKGYIKQDANNANQLRYAYNPVPYDINFSLYVAVKNTEDGTRILEQILPYFTPEWTATINLIPELDVRLDIPTVLLNVSSEDIYDGNYTERRSLVWTLDFLMKGYVFGPVKKSEVITLANLNFYANSYDSTIEPDERVTIIPGLTANGDPTTNASATVDRSLISANSNYGYITTYETVSNE
jgi:hypothetical protein